MGHGHDHGLADGVEPTDFEAGWERGTRVTWLAIWIGIGLTIVEYAAGYLGHSQALVADAVHSTEDTVATVVVLITLKLARRPADQHHPYGHGRAESLTTVGLGIVLGIAGLLILWSVANTIISGESVTPSTIALVAAGFSILVREFLYQLTYRVGKESGSPALVANAWHHRTDALSSIGALVGIGGAQLGVSFLDPLAGGIIALFVIKVAYDIVRDAVGQLMDRAPEEAVLEKISGIAEVVEGVEHVHQLRARRAGRFILVDLKVDIDPNLTVAEGHAIAGAVKHEILSGMANVLDVMVHVNPHYHPHEHRH